MYIDPNSGGMLFQILLVAFGMISGTVLIFSSKIKMGISKIRRSIREKRDQIDPSDLNSKKGKSVG
jgi:hypothetical protein